MERLGFFGVGVATAAALPVLAGSVWAMSEKVEQGRPNILVIMTDDLGYGDLGCYGGTTMRTPETDKLAAAGVRFTNFYMSAPRCTPSRGAFLTGRDPMRNGLTGLLWPEDTYGLADTEVTIATLLREHGYRTGLVGKWHVGHQPDQLPLQRGFDEWFGMPYPNDMDADHPRSQEFDLKWPPLPLYRGNEQIETGVDLDNLTTRYTAECERFIVENKSRPWFLFYATHVPHAYLAASDEFRGKSANGLFGDMVEEFDSGMGKIMAALRSSGQLENTVIIFTNDNGASWYPPKKMAEMMKDPRHKRIRADGSHGSNLPLRGGKNTPYEGGSRVPTFIIAPSIAKAGVVMDAPCSVTDLFPTIAALAGVPVPSDRKLDGVNLVPALLGEENLDPERTIIYDCKPIRAIRSGAWKLIYPSPAWEQNQKPPELYNIIKDIAEAQNVAAENPEIVAKLVKLLEDYKAQFANSPQP